MKKLGLLAAATVAASALAFAPSVGASTGECDDGGSGLGTGVLDIAGIAYVDNRDYLLGNGIWIYLESNGVGGLQRGGASLTGEGELCDDGHPAGPDMLIF
ncbi:MAG TPA: hypothetical protein VNB24_01560 [Acidimicrobiales bacterium]|nr:hypothetical protein [Acidimicrobiales bacterium]